MTRTIDDNFKHDTVHIEWHSEDEDLIANALAFYVHEINQAMKKYAEDKRKKDIIMETKVYKDYIFGITITPKRASFFNITKIVLNGYVTDARTGEDMGKKILTFKEGYYHREPFIPWGVGALRQMN